MGAVATCVYDIKVKQNEWRMDTVSACNAFFNVFFLLLFLLINLICVRDRRY